MIQFVRDKWSFVYRRRVQTENVIFPRFIFIADWSSKLWASWRSSLVTHFFTVGRGGGNLSLKTPLRCSSGDMVKSFNKSLRTWAENLPKCIVSCAANQASTRDVLRKTVPRSYSKVTVYIQNLSLSWTYLYSFEGRFLSYLRVSSEAEDIKTVTYNP